MDIVKGKEYWNKVTKQQKDILLKMGVRSVLEVHSDGDLTFYAGSPGEGGKGYVLTTSGDLFAAVSPPFNRSPMVGQENTFAPIDEYRVPPSAY